jgi:eukaryotic-like serine/threonine-protein kinase
VYRRCPSGSRCTSVGEDGRLVLVDFGIAAVDGGHPLGRDDPEVVVGSPAYMAPELVRGETPGPAADLWSFGATLYAAVEGHAPFPHGDPVPILAAVLHDPPPPARLAGPLQPLLTGLLVKDPAGRPSHDAIHALLTTACPAAATTALTSARTGASARPRTHRHWPGPDRPPPADCRNPRASFYSSMNDPRGQLESRRSHD